MGNGNGEQAQAQKEELKLLVSSIGNTAAKLYDIMKEGSTIEIRIPESASILVPNQPVKVGRLFITKPIMFAQIVLKEK